MKRYLIIIMVLCFIQLNGQSILGKWKTIDDETGKAKSIVNIYKKGDKYYGDIIELLNASQPNPKCDECKDELKGKPILGMTIINDMEFDEDEYSNGTILNPSNGKVYKCQLKFEDNPDELRVRGYVAFFYKTQYWKRVK